ncbi:MAG: hypothetical protein ACPL6C_04265, partial [bacterium]
MSERFEHAKEVLEFDKIIELLAGETSSPLGREKALKICPLDSIEECYKSFKLIDEIRAYFAYNGLLPLENLYDLRDFVEQAKKDFPLKEEELFK